MIHEGGNSLGAQDDRSPREGGIRVVRESMRQDETAMYAAAWQSIDCLKHASDSHVARSV